MSGLDKQARKILFNTYWQGSGWIDSRSRQTAPDDLAYAKAQGLMFDPLTIGHDDCLNEVLALHASITAADVGRAFVASLSSRRPDWRSALATYACVDALRAHTYTPVKSGSSYDAAGNETHVSYTCEICRDAKSGLKGAEAYRDEDLNVLNFERLKWGGVRHGSLIYSWLDLRVFKTQEIGQPDAEDVAILQAIFQAITASAPGDLASTLERALKPLLPSSKDERRILIEILACADILQARSLDRPARGKSDWRFVSDWRGEDGFDAGQAQRYFGPYLG